MGLPTDDKGRKALPIFRGPLMYFPDALLALANVCKVGNDQHNPGEPLHWARGKSTEQMDTALRHMMDHGLGNTKDIDGTWHLAKAAWRILAELQIAIENAQALAEADDAPPSPAALLDAFAELDRALSEPLGNEYTVELSDMEEVTGAPAPPCNIYGCTACAKAKELDGAVRSEGVKW